MLLSTSTVDNEACALGLLRVLLRNDRDLVARAQELAVPRAGRGWIRVADTEAADAWLIAWSPASAVGTHDHGGSHGAVHVLRGELTERFCGRDDPRAHLRTLARGATVSVPLERVHDVANNGLLPALSLHVYAPRLTTMSFYPPVASSRD